MNLQILAQNIRRLRTAKRFSQKALAEAAGLSLPAVKNLELAKNEPRMRTVQAIARALDVKLQELFQPVRRLRTVRFRSAKRMQNRENILAEVSRWLDDFNYLEEALNRRALFKLEGIWEKCSKDNIVEAAALCRKKLRLKPVEPIYDICGLLEDAGIKIHQLSMASDSFFGLSIAENDGGPAIVVNAWERIPVERRIFSAAHELGHLMLHRDAFDVSQTEENKIEENEVNLFSGHFLMPDEGFFKEWNEASGLHPVDRVFKVKRIFHVSYEAVLFPEAYERFAPIATRPGPFIVTGRVDAEYGSPTVDVSTLELVSGLRFSPKAPLLELAAAESGLTTPAARELDGFA